LAINIFLNIRHFPKFLSGFAILIEQGCPALQTAIMSQSMTDAPKPLISLVVARARDGAIGRQGNLPWQISEDLKFFKRLTVGKPIVMGRKTYDSIGRPLPGRHNIVVTRNKDWRAEGVTVVPNLAEAIVAAGLDPKIRAAEIMIIGGGEIYAQALLFADRVYLTEVDINVPDADAHFPPLDPAQWRETARDAHAAVGDVPGYAFVTLERR
jgi:dihydrofolate reductase